MSELFLMEPIVQVPIVDMPIDPNEPTYCLCGQVSYGEMIGCDNQDCPIEWFHFECVKLTRIPKGKWYCPICRGSKSKHMKRKVQNVLTTVGEIFDLYLHYYNYSHMCKLKF